MPVVNIKMFEGRDDAKAAIAKDVTEVDNINASAEIKLNIILFIFILFPL